MTRSSNPVQICGLGTKEQNKWEWQPLCPPSITAVTRLWAQGVEEGQCDRSSDCIGGELDAKVQLLKNWTGNLESIKKNISLHLLRQWLRQLLIHEIKKSSIMLWIHVTACQFGEDVEIKRGVIFRSTETMWLEAECRGLLHHRACRQTGFNRCFADCMQNLSHCSEREVKRSVFSARSRAAKRSQSFKEH